MRTAPTSARLAPIALACAALACAADAGGDISGPQLTAATNGESTSAGAAATSEADTGEPPPEEEDEGDFRVPQASGKYVYSASETTDSVAVIDTATLVIDVVEVGQGPTVVRPIPGDGDAGSVVVLDQRSDDIAVLRTGPAGTTSVALYPVTAGANNLAVSPDGAHVLVFHDHDGPEQLGPGSDQELTVLDLAAGTTYAMTVGAHPRDVVFSTDHQTAWVITAAGVNVLRFADLGLVGKPPLLPVVTDPGLDPATIEVQVSASLGVALARVHMSPWIAVTDLEGGALTVLDLPGAPTDLDIAPAGDFAILTIADTGGSSFLELSLPLDPDTPFTAHAVDGEYVGQSAISPDGDAMLLFTTVDPYALTLPPSQILLDRQDDPEFAGSSDTGSSTTTGDTSTGADTTAETTTSETTAGPPPPDPRQRITLARRDGPTWSLVTQFVEVPVASVGVAPDSATAILVHTADATTPAAPWSYSLLDLTPQFPLLKRQNTEAEPGTVLFTPDGDRAAVLLRDDAADIRKVDLVDLGNFIVAPLQLGSPPEGAGHVDVTEKIYVSQAHPTGRITFIDPAGAVQTVTGYVLNDSVKD